MTAIEPVRVGLIGCGHISGIYLENAQRLPHVQVVACADLDRSRAEERAREFEVPCGCSVSELLRDPEIELVLNLTVPAAHAEVSHAAIAHGKHVYSEKPLATSTADGRRLVEAAAAAKRLVGCAPDTFLGAGLQAARHLIDDGAIGVPVGATAFFLGRGMEHWHANPEFFYQPGAGPLFDMGPYYLTALVALLGPVRAVSGMARITFPERTIGSQPLAGSTFAVRTPTYVSGLLGFDSGPICSTITTFDVRHHTLPHIEIYGQEGTLRVPDPNRFDGPVLVRGRNESEFQEVVTDSPYSENWRGLGLDDMARALRCGGLHRASGALAFHVLEVMEGLLESAVVGRLVSITSTAERPEAYP
jgi:predicted dehydrogenase